MNGYIIKKYSSADIVFSLYKMVREQTCSLTKHYTINEYTAQCRLSSTHSRLWKEMELSGQLQALATFLPPLQPPALFE
jgi:hypothetical protein